MEAPEKIYVTESMLFMTNPEITLQGNGNKLEYTRTDALIEKAEKYFIEKFEVEDYNDYVDVDGSPIFNYGRFIEDFRKYMRGGDE